MDRHRTRKVILSIFRFVEKRADAFAFGIIFIVVTLGAVPTLSSGGKWKAECDFFQYSARHEAVRKSIVEYHTFPLRSHWFGGGYPTLGDPEDPSLNPLVVLSILFGTIRGLKAIYYLALLIGGLSAYALARYVLGYTRWGSLFAGLMFGVSLFVPIRMADGNPNEVYAAFLPLCMLLIGLACQKRKLALLILPFVFYTMLSDGKLNFFAAILYLAIFCLLHMVPAFRAINLENSSGKVDIRPMKFFLIALCATFFIGMVRILPALEVINARGGLGDINLFFRPEKASAYTFERFWQELLGWKGRRGYVTVGVLPIILFGVSLFAFWKRSLPWGIGLVLFGWLMLGHNAPIDLLKLLWKLPIFNAFSRPTKYFSFQIAFTFAVASGQFFWLLAKLRPRWLEHLCAVILIVAGMWFLYPKMIDVQRDVYDFEVPDEFLVPEEEFFSIQGQGLKRDRKEPSMPNNDFVARWRGAAADIKLEYEKDMTDDTDWHHAALVWDTRTGKKLYFDGELVGESPNTNTVPICETCSFMIAQAVDKEYDFKGFIDEVAIFNIALARDDIKDIMKEGILTGISKAEIDPKTIIGLWLLDEGTGKTAKDSSGNDNNGALMGGPEWVQGRSGKALRFDGKDDVVDFGKSSALQPDTGTIHIWFKFDSIKGNHNQLYQLFDKGVHSNDNGVAFYYDGTYSGTALPLRSIAYLNLLRNVGTIDWYTAVPLAENAIPRYFVNAKNKYIPNPKYRGEAFFLNTKNEAKALLRPNSIAVEIHVQEPDTLIINQNYHRDWHTNRGELFSKDGLIALRLHETGSYRVDMRYIPRAFYTGLAISILSLAALGFICWTYITGRLLNWVQHGSPFLRYGSRAILWLID